METSSVSLFKSIKMHENSDYDNTLHNVTEDIMWSLCKLKKTYDAHEVFLSLRITANSNKFISFSHLTTGEFSFTVFIYRFFHFHNIFYNNEIVVAFRFFFFDCCNFFMQVFRETRRKSTHICLWDVQMALFSMDMLNTNYTFAKKQPKSRNFLNFLTFETNFLFV